MTATPREMANAVRFLALDAMVRVGDGHPGTPLGAADICTALFTRHLKFDPADPRWPDRDRFVQSNGHGSTLIYSLLHLAGYAAFPLEQVKRFRELGSTTPGTRNTSRTTASRSPPARWGRASPTRPGWRSRRRC